MDEVDAGSLDAGFASTKKEILTTLKRDGRTSLANLAQSLGISKMATLKHLTALEAKGIVERSFQAGGRGRPRAYFALTSKAARLFPEAYANMTICALQFIEQKMGRPAVVRLLQQRNQEVYARNRHRFEDKDFPGRVEELVSLREESGYMAQRGKIGTRSAEVLEHNCPIMAVAQSYGEACTAEVEMFQKLLHADVEATHRVVAGAPVCRFVVWKRSEFRS
jgi:predicted ArsR family transcriptional regulator